MADSESRPFKVGETMIVSTAVKRNEKDEIEYQVQEPINISHKTNTGRIISYLVRPIINPYQFQTGRTLDYYKYRVDGATSITISKIYPKAEISLYLFKEQSVIVPKTIKYYFYSVIFYIKNKLNKKSKN